MTKRIKIIHFMHHPVSAKRFVEPLVISMIESGYDVELCITDYADLKNFISSFKVPCALYEFNMVLNLSKIIKSTYRLFFYVRKKNPILIQAHQTRAAFIPLRISWLNQVPVRIYHNHGVPYIGYRGYKGYALRLLEGLNCYLATHIVTVSQGMVNPLKLVASHLKSVDVLGPGSACGLAEYDFNYLDPHEKSLAKEKYGFDGKCLIFLYVGRPEKRKGFNILIRAFNEIFSGRADVCLLLAGCTSDDIKSTGHENHKNIHALGTLMDLNPIYDIADIVVLPSFHEGFGYALLEGAAHGCALITSDIPGPDCLVFENINGALVRPNALIDLENKLNHFYCNKVELMIMGKNSYQISLGYERSIILGYYKNYITNILNELN